MRTFTRGLLCIQGLVLALSLGAAQPARAAVPVSFYGVNAGGLFFLPQDQWDAQLGAMAAGGIGVVRMPAYWSEIEPQPPDAGGHQYLDWQQVDAQVAAMARHGLTWQPLICFSASWDESVPGDYASAPAGVDHFAAFAAALARRYGRGGSFWAEHPELHPFPVSSYELWNEPNATPYWHPQADAPEAYADLYAAARAAVHAVDPAARVVVGGLASAAPGVFPAARFLERMFAHRPDLRGGVDAVAYHPYAPTPEAVYALLRGFRRALDAAAGPGVPIEVSEVGWSTFNTPEQTRAADLDALAKALPRSDCGVDGLMPYAWIGPEQDPADQLQWFGIFNRDGTPKLSGAAYGRAAEMMERADGRVHRVRICKPALRLRVRAISVHPGARPRLTVSSSCAVACALSLRVTAARGARMQTLARRSLRYHRGARRVHITLPRDAWSNTRLALRARAWSRTGAKANRVRAIRLRGGSTASSRRRPG